MARISEMGHLAGAARSRATAMGAVGMVASTVMAMAVVATEAKARSDPALNGQSR
jgi:hypothetical protein